MLVQKWKLVCSLIILGCLANAQASEHKDSDHDHEHEHEHEEHQVEQHGAHEHGKAQLTFALEGGNVAIELDSPAANLVGFEHSANTEEQRKTVETAHAALADGEHLFHFPNKAGCQQISSHVDMGMLAGEHDQHDDEDHHKHDDHDKDHDHEGEAEGEGQHADISAQWAFKCSNPANIDHVDIELLHHFPAIEALNVDYLIPGKQGAATLHPDSKMLKLQ